jgi:hypothetical protein
VLWFKIGHRVKPLRGTARFEQLFGKMNFPADTRTSVVRARKAQARD